jgi:hypothetical protein
MRKSLRLLVLVVATTLGALALTAPASAAAPYCGITWGSLDKSSGTTDPTSASLSGVRAGQHDCFDRLVIDLANAGGVASYTVRYHSVDGVGTGLPVAVSGGASLEIILRAHGENFSIRDPNHVVSVSGFRTFRQVVSAGSLEGTTVLGVGTRARLPFRVFTLSGPGAGQTRLVIDVAHRW